MWCSLLLEKVFAGCLCYADDIVLLAPCPSALRIMLNISKVRYFIHEMQPVTRVPETDKLRFGIVKLQTVTGGIFTAGTTGV